MRIGILYSRLRVEEKWLFAALDERDIEYDRLLDREVTFDLTTTDDW
jgi:[lysine-biosynthesis-protein LysW]--L-2-aminoadipate ligase